ncbi:MAG: LpxD N-terminal domain-containing protein, partial [Planctomycetota bacterium]
MNDLGPALHSSRTAAEIAALVAGSVEGAEDTVVRGIDTVEHATKGDLTFIGDARHARHWSTSEASVAMVTRDLALGEWDCTAAARRRCPAARGRSAPAARSRPAAASC